MKKQKAQWIKTDAAPIDVEPANGFAFTLEELQKFVEGGGSKTVQFISFPDGRQLVCNDNGLIVGLEANEIASQIWKEQFPIDKYPHNNGGTVVGNVLISTPEWVGVIDYDGGTIKGYAATRKVEIDNNAGEQLTLDAAESQKIINHSPDGFAWGYGGSGPSQLALAILLELTDEKTARSAYQQFKFDTIAALPQDEDFSIEVDDVLEWLVEWRTAQT